ncbi:hypothetical protein D3C87_689700 [compost metagenome]
MKYNNKLNLSVGRLYKISRKKNTELEKLKFLHENCQILHDKLTALSRSNLA